MPVKTKRSGTTSQCKLLRTFQKLSKPNVDLGQKIQNIPQGLFLMVKFLIEFFKTGAQLVGNLGVLQAFDSHENWVIFYSHADDAVYQIISHKKWLQQMFLEIPPVLAMQVVDVY